MKSQNRTYFRSVTQVFSAQNRNRESVETLKLIIESVIVHNQVYIMFQSILCSLAKRSLRTEKDVSHKHLVLCGSTENQAPSGLALISNRKNVIPQLYLHEITN